MFRSGFGVVALVLVGFVLIVAAVANTTGTDAGRSARASEVGVASSVVDGAPTLLRPRPVAASPANLRQRHRISVSEPSALLLMGLVLLGAAHFARRQTRTNR